MGPETHQECQRVSQNWHVLHTWFEIHVTCDTKSALLGAIRRGFSLCGCLGAAVGKARLSKKTKGV